MGKYIFGWYIQLSLFSANPRKKIEENRTSSRPKVSPNITSIYLDRHGHRPQSLADRSRRRLSLQCSCTQLALERHSCDFLFDSDPRDWLSLQKPENQVFGLSQKIYIKSKHRDMMITTEKYQEKMLIIFLFITIAVVSVSSETSGTFTCKLQALTSPANCVDVTAVVACKTRVRFLNPTCQNGI